MPTIHSTRKSINTGPGCCFWFAVLCFLSLPSMLVAMMVLIFLSFPQPLLEFSYAWFALSGKVYKSWCLNALELSFIFNLGMLSVATIYVKLSGGSQAAVASTSVGVAFLSFLVIVTYHTYIQIKSKVQCIQCDHQLQHMKEKFKGNCKNPGNLEHPCVVTPNNNTTCTEVDLHELQSPLDLLDTK